MLKKLIAATLSMIMICAICLPTVSFAAYGNTIPSSAVGSRNDLIYIKRPESHSASTSDKTYTISAVGGSGTKVWVYKYNSSTNSFNLIKGETQIGASGLYSVVVDLNDNSNVFIIYAENAYGNQIERIDINKIKKSTVDKLKGITVTIKNFLS